MCMYFFIKKKQLRQLKCCFLFIDSTTPTPPSSADSGLGRRKIKHKKPKGYVTSKKGVTHTPVQYHAFPKAKPLPAVGKTYPKINGVTERADSSRCVEINGLFCRDQWFYLVCKD